MREESQKPEAVIQRHEDDSSPGESRAAIQHASPRSREERAAVKKDDDRSTFRIAAGSPDIEGEAVLTLFHRITGEIATNPGPRLGRDGRHDVGREDPLPGLDGLWRSESRRTRNRCRVADAKKAPTTIGLDAAHPTRVCRNYAVEQKRSSKTTSISDVSNPEFRANSGGSLTYGAFVTKVNGCGK
jgi:hypothetical protein